MLCKTFATLYNANWQIVYEITIKVITNRGFW